jgi:SAM-dependent methyltransferase
LRKKGSGLRNSEIDKNDIERSSDKPLWEFLACPDCRNSLIEINMNRLKCNVCGRDYEIRNGIPLLYPQNMDFEHLREEENLAKMMKRKKLKPKDLFSSKQWEYSKKEFWQMVQNSIGSNAKIIVNIGCGYDKYFSLFQQKDHIFINFDIVYNMLIQLKSDYNAKACVAGDIGSLPFKKGLFDCIVCIDVIHHECDELLRLFESFKDLLKPGGILFLEDVNAWGMYQFVKSILLPRPLHRFLRFSYHRLKHSDQKPADYEFPTNLWQVKKMLKKIGFCKIKVYSNSSYPNIGPLKLHIYNFFSKIDWIKKYHNFHYMLSAVKSR